MQYTLGMQRHKAPKTGIARLFLILLLLLFVAVLGYALFAYWRYERVSVAPHPCLGAGDCVSVNNVDLYYRIEGSRIDTVPVILVHGGPGDSSLSFKSGFSFLAADRRVLYYDQRASGQSELKKDNQDLSMETLVGDIEALRRDVLKTERIILIGHSFGGALAQRYALAYPERTAKLVLLGSLRVNNGMKSAFFWRYLGPALYASAMGFPPATGADADAWLTRYANQETANRMGNPADAHKLDGTGLVSFIAWRELSASLPGKNYHEELRQLNVDTLCMYGAHDAVYTGEPVAAELASLMPRFRMVRFEHSGHWIYLEEPDRFAAELTTFIAE